MNKNSILIDWLVGVVLCLALGLLMLPLLWAFGGLPHLFTLGSGAFILAFGSLFVAILLQVVLGVFFKVFRLAGDGGAGFDIKLVVNSLAAMGVAVISAAFIAAQINIVVTTMPLWATVLTYGTGLLACWVAYAIWSVAFPGTAYKFVSMITVVISYAVFSYWQDGPRWLFSA